MTSSNNEPIIIARALGNNLADGASEDNEIFCWLIHDLEHLIYGENSILGDYHEGWSNWPHAYEDYTIEIDNVKEGFPEDNDYLESEEKEGFLNHLALSKFFTEINFTKSVGGNDFPASIFAYCILKMSNANDVTEINNTQTLNDEEKQRLKNIFSNAFESANNQIDLLIEKLEDKIFVCLEF